MTMIQERKQLLVRDLGIVEYDHAYSLQKQSFDVLLQGGSQALLLCEHPTVLTLGRLANERHILVSKKKLESHSVSIRHIDRGGEVTLHAPGQLVVYPILDLTQHGKDLHSYMRLLEQVVIDLLDDFDIVASRIPGQTGVWIEKKKIASIGIGVRKWITFHGLSINVNMNLSLYSMIRPCGLDVQMTSLAKNTSIEISMPDVKRKVINCFYKNFNFIGVLQ